MHTGRVEEASIGLGAARSPVGARTRPIDASGSPIRLIAAFRKAARSVASTDSLKACHVANVGEFEGAKPHHRERSEPINIHAFGVSIFCLSSMPAVLWILLCADLPFKILFIYKKGLHV